MVRSQGISRSVADGRSGDGERMARHAVGAVGEVGTNAGKPKLRSGQGRALRAWPAGAGFSRQKDGLGHRRGGRRSSSAERIDGASAVDDLGRCLDSRQWLSLAEPIACHCSLPSSRHAPSSPAKNGPVACDSDHFWHPRRVFRLSSVSPSGNHPHADPRLIEVSPNHYPTAASAMFFHPIPSS